MKIAFLSEKYTPDIGGLAISTERIVQLLATAGHQVRVFSPTQSLPASEKRTLPHHKVSVTRFGAQKHMDDTLVDWFELIVEEHKREPFDLIHAYFLPQAGFVAAYTGKYLNIPSVVSIRGNDIERSAFDPGRFSHVMYALQNASAVTTNAVELAKKAKAFIDRPIQIIPNGVDTDLFKKVAKNNTLAKSLGLDEQRYVVGFAGELRSKKGFSTLLLGYTQINKMMPCTLLIVGSVRAGEYQQAFEDFHRNNPDTRIVVTGSVPHKDLPAYYSLMDVFVHPSLRDGMPNAILEAMACELPIVATPVGGIMEVIEDGITGKTVPVRDVATFVKTTINLLGDLEERVRLGKSAREKVLNDYAPDKELRANLEIYQSLNNEGN